MPRENPGQTSLLLNSFTFSADYLFVNVYISEIIASTAHGASDFGLFGKARFFICCLRVAYAGEQIKAHEVVAIILTALNTIVFMQAHLHYTISIIAASKPFFCFILCSVSVVKSLFFVTRKCFSLSIFTGFLGRCPKFHFLLYTFRKTSLQNIKLDVFPTNEYFLE